MAVIALASPLPVQAQEPSTHQFLKAIAAADIRTAIDPPGKAEQRAWLNTWNANGASPIARGERTDAS